MSILSRVRSIPGLADVLCSVLLGFLPASFIWLHNSPPLSALSIMKAFDLGYAISLLSMFLYARNIGFARQAAIIASIVYAFNGYGVARTISPEILQVYALLPLALCFIERIFHKPGVLDWFGGMIVIAIILVISHSYYPVFALMIIIGYSLFSATLRRMKWKYALKFIGAALMMCVVGGAVFTSWIMKFAPPGSLVMTRSYDVFSAYSIQPFSLLTLVFPCFTGGGRTIYSMSYWGGGVGLDESQLYLGVATLSLAFTGMIFALNTRYRLGIFWSVSALIGIVLSLGKYTDPLSELIHRSSRMRLFEGPNRYWILVVLAVSVLAGYTVDRLVRLDSAVIQGYLRTFALFLTLFVLWIGGFTLWKKDSAEGFIRSLSGLSNISGNFLQSGDSEFYIPMIMASLACATIIAFSFMSKRRSAYIVLTIFVILDFYLAAFYCL